MKKVIWKQNGGGIKISVEGLPKIGKTQRHFEKKRPLEAKMRGSEGRPSYRGHPIPNETQKQVVE